MTLRHRSRICKIATGAGVLLLVALAYAPTGSAADKVSLALTDPRTGDEVRVESGARALHVVFFATWCSPCLDELKALSNLEARWHGSGYRLVLVAVQQRHTTERLTQFVAEREPPGELLFDAAGRAEAALRADQLPTHVVFDAQGAEVARAGSVEDGVGEVVARLIDVGSRGRR